MGRKTPTKDPMISPPSGGSSSKFAFSAIVGVAGLLVAYFVRKTAVFGSESLGRHRPPCEDGILWDTNIATYPPVAYHGDRSLWGTFQPGLYFGMKSATLPTAISTSIMWTDSVFSEKDLRFSTHEDVKFDWVVHDGSNFGVQRIQDAAKNLYIDTTFVVPSRSRDGALLEKLKVGDAVPSWIQSFDISVPPGSKKTDSSNSAVSFFLNFGLDCFNSTLVFDCIETAGVRNIAISKAVGTNHRVTLTGVSAVSGQFRMDLIPRPLRSAKGEGYPEEVGDMVRFYSGSNSSDLANTIGAVQKETARLSGLWRQKKRSRKSTIFDRSGAFKSQLDPDASSVIFQLNSNTSMTIDVVFYEHLSSLDDRSLIIPLPALVSETKNELVRKYTAAFNEDWNRIYGGSTSTAFGDAGDEVAKTALSSLLGGIGFFVGSPLVGIAKVDEHNANGHSICGHDGSTVSRGGLVSLFSASPSRTVFPRGFLWDEGFHQMVIQKWNMDLSLQTIGSWLDTMHFPVNQNHCDYAVGHCVGGWIPREMILGDVGESRVPFEFVIQRPDIANPPTLLLVLEGLLDDFDSKNPATVSCLSDSATTHSCVAHLTQREKLLSFLKKAFERLHVWVQWYVQSQRGSEKYAGSFRWRGRSTKDGKVIPNTLSSGLDDYPRSPQPAEDEIHVDLLCWMASAARTMSRIQRELDVGASVKTPKNDTYDYKSQFMLYQNSVDAYHWSDTLRGYFDVGLHSNESHFVEEVLYRCSSLKDGSGVDVLIPIETLKRGGSPASYCPKSHPKPMYPMGDGNGNLMIKEKMVSLNLSRQHIPRVGYVNIYPLLLTVIPANADPKLNAVLDMIENPALLWTPHGLRSIATTDMFYKRWNSPGDAPYWRGPIWMPINYLAVKALKHYSAAANSADIRERCARLYSLLRVNLIQTVVGEYRKTGYFWEQYDDISGEGIRGHPFTGWTATIVNILAEKY